LPIHIIQGSRAAPTAGLNDGHPFRMLPSPRPSRSCGPRDCQ
jgi:hypothetical protein